MKVVMTLIYIVKNVTDEIDNDSYLQWLNNSQMKLITIISYIN